MLRWFNERKTCILLLVCIVIYASMMIKKIDFGMHNDMKVNMTVQQYNSGNLTTGIPLEVNMTVQQYNSGNLTTRIPLEVNMTVQQYNSRNLGTGIPLEVPIHLLSMLDLPRTNFLPPASINKDDLVFVTASSSNHFDESIDAVASVQKHFPTNKIVYFDIGLQEHQIKKIHNMCNVEYRHFPLTKFKPYMDQNLRHCAWKPIVIQMVLKEHNSVAWFDSSTRFNTDDIKPIFKTAKSNGGAVLMLNTWHSVHAATHPHLYKYFPVNYTKTPHIEMYGGGCIFLWATQAVYEHVLNWWIACTLNMNCMSPPGSSLDCKFKMFPNRYSWYAHCHRYDQSVINVLMANWMGYDTKEYIVAQKGKVETIRKISRKYELQDCTVRNVTKGTEIV